MTRGFVMAALLGGAASAAYADAPASQLQSLVTTPHIDFETAEPLYRETMKRDGNTDAVVAQLQAMSRESSRPRRQRANALLIASHLQWQYGARPAAQASVDAALKIDTTADIAFQQACLLEAAGELTQAQRWYDTAFALYADPKRKEEVRLRMTFVAVGQQNAEALVSLARTRDRDFRNRAAVALAVMNRYGEAAGLYQVYGDDAARFRQHLRLAQWALEAGETKSAQEEAWQAVQLASLDRDQRYALSVLVDAYEADNSLGKLLDRLQEKGRLSADEQDIRIDLLQKLRRYDEAIRLFNESGRTDITPASRRQLLRMYSDAGKPEQMEAEYRKLIAAEPEQYAWSEGLAQRLMQKGDREGAIQVWREFIGHNTQAEVLMAGAASMSRFGFDELALAAADKVVKVEPAATSEAMLFRFELNLRRGKTAAAEAVLADMDKALPADSVDRLELADAYERIKKPAEALRVFQGLDAHRAGGLGNDERMRMAWLYDSTGQRAQALAVWKSLWSGQTPDAFRRLVEDRLVKLAAETGALGDLAVELELKLAAGTASKKDAGLLIRIYTDTNDSASAVEVIREYFRRTGKSAGADVEGLREQANVYRTLGRFQAYRTITTRLLTLDPANKVDYLQSLVLNQLENKGERTQAQKDELFSWLSQLRDTGGGAASTEFEAGILVLADMEDKAIASYRSALAANPGNSDNYLLLADLLKKKGREAEAIAALQYLVETADHDDAFIVGVDGLLNLKPQDKAVIQWAQRRVLERLTARDDKLYLYDLLAELAEESGNRGMYFSALENSLAFASSRRSAVLRELIDASAKSSRNATRGIVAAGKADDKRNLRYSRRLMSLGEELPPAVYTDMGKVFLSMNDPESATDSFNRAIDRTGDPGLVEQTGDLFRGAGFSHEAGLQYEKALITDSDNAAIMRKLADVRLSEGHVQQARDLYERALLDVLQGLPQELEQRAQGKPPAFDDTTSFEYKDIYPNLLSGFLYTLSAQDFSFPAMAKAFDEVLAESMHGVSGQSGKALAYYPRLNAFSRFMREACLRSGRYELADSLDSGLMRYFASDEGFVSVAVSQRKHWGLTASAARIASLAQGRAAQTLANSGDEQTGGGMRTIVPSRESARQALAAYQYEKAIGLALYSKDQGVALSAYREWARSALQSGPPDMEALRRGQMPASIVQIMMSARQRLDGAGFASLSRYVIDRVRDTPELQRLLIAGGSSLAFNFGFFGNDSSMVLDMEKAAGRNAMTESELRDLSGIL